MVYQVEGSSGIDLVRGYVIQKRWVAVALLIASVVIFGGLSAVGGVNLFTPLGLSPVSGVAALFVGAGGAPLGIAIALILLFNQGRSALHRAIQSQKDIDSLPKLMVDRDINQPDHNGNRPLHYAVFNEEALKILLADKRIDVNAINDRGYTPFQEAVLENRSEAAKEILGHKSIVVDASLVEWAINNGSEEVVNVLLARNEIIQEWRKPLLAAIRKHNELYVKSILAKYQSADNSDLQEALVIAASHHVNRSVESAAVFDAILTKGVDVNAKHEGTTALHIAANGHDLSLIDKLLSHDQIDVNLVDASGRTPAELALIWPWVEVVKRIIDTKKISKENLLKLGQQARLYVNTPNWKEVNSIVAALDNLLRDCT